MGRTKRRSTPASQHLSPGSEGRPETPQFIKPKKPTAAANAEAIQELSQKVDGYDSRFKNIADLLSELSNKIPDPQAPLAGPDPQVLLTTGPAAATSRRAYSASPSRASRPGPAATGMPPPGFPGYSWAAPAHHATTPGPGPSNLHFTGAYAQPPDAYQTTPWDHPTTITDLETDPALTRRVAVALQTVANPYAQDTGKPALFPHQVVTRGAKQNKTSMGELSLPEYIWGYIQMIKAQEPSDPQIQFMNIHLERVIEDAKTYEWSAVRRWSEEICARIALRKLSWGDMYEIDRLQGRMSHNGPTIGSSSQSSTAREGSVYELSDELRRAKPAPPCKAFQQGNCTSLTDHVQNGYRHIHVCSYCLSAKCAFMPHASRDCKSKAFGAQKKNTQESGFGTFQVQNQK